MPRIAVLRTVDRATCYGLICVVFLSWSLAAQAQPAQTTPPQTTTSVEKQLPVPVVQQPRVALETSQGRIVIELFPEHSPKNVANFLTYVKDGHYNGTIFHRVIADMLIQGGGFTSDLNQKPERKAVINESDNGLKNLRGTVSAARRPNNSHSAGAQFFINLVDNPQFDRSSDASAFTSGYTVIGKIVEGMDVVDKIRLVETGAKPPFTNFVPKTTIIIEQAKILDVPSR